MAGNLNAQTSTETKIDLMEAALKARDAGDYATAKQRLETLEKLSPHDAAVTRMLAEVNQKLAAQSARSEESSVAPSSFLDEEAEAIARAETARLRDLLEKANTQRKTARSLARDKHYDKALGVLDAISSELPRNPLTDDMLQEIHEDEANLLVEQCRYLLKSGDLSGARTAMDRRLEIMPGTRITEKLENDLGKAEARSAAAMNSVQLSEPRVAVSTGDSELESSLRRARSQYVAGARATALASYHEIARRYPDNEEAQNFISRISSEQGTAGVIPRTETRSSLLSEVDQSWQRPEIFQEQERSASRESDSAPMIRKLDSIVLPNVSFTQVEIGRVVSALSAVSQEFDPSAEGVKGVNVVLLDPGNEKPKVTLTLRNTSLKRVLDFVTQSIGYQYEIQADAVVVRPGGESTSLDTDFFPVSRATVLRMTGAGSSGGSDSSASSNPFSSAGASNDSGPSSNEAPGMQAFLQQAGVNFEGTSGSSLAYDGSSIIVTQTARNLERIRNILNRYNDIRQVEIEAKFMEVQEGALEELGVNWNVATKATQRNAGVQADYSTSNRALSAAYSSSVGTQQGSIVRPGGQTIDANGNISVSSDLNIPILTTPSRIPGSSYLGAGANALASVAGVIGEFNVNAVVRALSQKEGTDLLSAPKITVLSGNPATITVAQELRYPQSFGQTQSQVGTGSASGGGSAGVAITAGTPQEFEKRNVGVELKVTPTVEEDDYSISLDLNPTVTEFDGFVEYGGPSVAISGNTTVTVPSGFYQPIFSVRDIKTKVTIWDGATLIMGGLTREEVKKVNDKVPVLGDIPFLGKLFRSKGESTQKRNLLIFVTANLLSPGGSPKKQNLRNVAPSSLFQNPVLVTPSGSEPRNDK